MNDQPPVQQGLSHTEPDRTFKDCDALEVTWGLQGGVNCHKVEPVLTRTRAAAWTAFGGFTVYTGTLSILRYETVHSRSLDMAYYVRLVWGLAHGAFDQPVVDAPHLLGLHLEPILLPFALLCRLHLPIAEMLLVVQALAAGAALFPAFALARRHVGPVLGDGWALTAALCIYLVPTVSRCIDYDFHPSTQAVWPLLAFVNALDAGHLRRATGWFAFALSCREDVGLQAACAALTMVAFPLRAGERRTALALAAFGTAWFVGYAFLVQPHFLPPASHNAYGAHFAGLGGEVGQGVPGVLTAALRDPIRLVAYLTSEDRPAYPLLLLLQVALLPLLAPRWTAGALPIVAINVLSSFPRIRTLQAHYVTAAAPFLCASAIVGCGVLAAKLHGRGRLAPKMLMLASATCFALRGLSPASPEWNAGNYTSDRYARQAAALTSHLASDARISAPPRLLAHLAERRDAFIVK